MPLNSPLPVRRGVNATRLHLPETGPWPTVHDYLLERFGHIDPASITTRFHDGEVVDSAGIPLSTSTPLGAAEFIWYYRSLPEETLLPVTEEVLFQDDHLVVADKPHFLPTTPAGRYVQESLLVRLRNRLHLPDLTPIHRLDRGTAGLVLFAKNPETRGKYQLLFERRQVDKTYEAISAVTGDRQLTAARFPVTVRNRIAKTKGVLTSQLMPYAAEDSRWEPRPLGPVQTPERWYGPGRGASHDHLARVRRRKKTGTGPNASSRIELLELGLSRAGRSVVHLRLTPHTGKTHQLRIHLAMLGLGILHDRFYPELLEDAPDDFNAPLQLLARRISFIDPLSGAARSFTSTRRLVEAPVSTGQEA
ncbi:pseudouridine synthase [Nesterenkonia ebinurensis]|uniref:pseudouridine synthase n=1 Tax=Nesterenkonia ebinurensis TaxID=2608252 RepID=UPI00123CF4AC|nr:pseudouridine synthase [Nesterenkonia ebinurensis]